MSNKTDVNSFIEELNAGIFKEKLAHLLSEAALGVVAHGGGKRKGKVSIEFTLAQVGENEQVIVSHKVSVIVSHKVSHKTPTKRGFKSEEDTTATPMFVGQGGSMTITPPREDRNGQSDFEGVSQITPKTK